MKWLLSIISKEWHALLPRVQEDRGAELEQQERERQERIEKRRQRREEEERFPLVMPKKISLTLYLGWKRKL